MISLLLGAAAPAPALPATVSYRMATATYERQFESFKESASIKQDVAYLHKKIEKIESLDDFVSDYRLFRIVLSAYGLESQINAKAFIKKVLSEDWRDPTTVAGKLVDPRFRDFTKALDYTRFGLSKLHSKPFLEGMIDRYLTVEFEKRAGATNPAVRHAMYFKRVAPGATNWLQILGDKPLFEVVRTALGIPNLGSQSNLDKQVKMLERRIGLANLSDPVFVDRFVSRYLAAYDSNPGVGQLNAASLVQPVSAASSATTLLNGVSFRV